MAGLPKRDPHRVDAAIETCLKAERVGKRSVLQSSFEEVCGDCAQYATELLAQIAFADEMRKRHAGFKKVDIFPALVIAAKRLLRA